MSGTLATCGMTPGRPGSAADGEAVVLETRVVTGPGGGPDKTILNTPRFLAATRYRTLCAYMHPPGDPGFEQIKSKALAWGAPLLSIPDRGPLDWRVVAELAGVCRRERVAIWHGHDYKSNLLGLLLRHRHPMRLVTTVHGWVRHTKRTPLYYGLDRYSLRHYDGVICVSDDLRERCLACGVPEGRCILIENAIDALHFSRAIGVGRDEARRRLGIATGRLVVGAVGRLSPEKGFDVLIRAADRLIASGVDLDVLIAGEGDDEGRLRALIDDLGLAGRVRLLGFQADPRPLYEALDAFALSSLREGLPNVLLEAMAMGVPAVATRIAGVPRLIRDKEDGLLVSPGSVDEMTAALGRILGDVPLRGRLSTTARLTVEVRYSFAVRMAKIRDLYDSLLTANAKGLDGDAT